MTADIKTNDRRKTFATPLEAMQWLIMAPFKRKVRNKQGVVLSVGHDYLGVVKFFSDGYSITVDYISCPLTAVEDEHGAIPEADPEKESAESAFVWHIRENADRYEYTEKLIALIDERIAAATVESNDAMGGPFEPDGAFRLKPKGDA